MTFPAPNPPLVIRTRLRARWTRRRIRYALAALLRRVAARLDPPREALDRARAAGHPSVTALQLVQGIEWHTRDRVRVLRPRGGAAS